MHTKLRSAIRHPSNLTSLIWFDGLSTTGDDTRRLTGYAAFEVTIEEPIEPIFDSHHAVTWNGEGIYGLQGDLAALLEDRHALVGSIEQYRTFYDRRHILRAGIEFIDLIRIVDGAQPDGMTLCGHHERFLSEVTNGFGIAETPMEDLLWRARYAIFRTQAIWLGYVMSVTKGREQKALLAGYRAWRVLQDARVVPF